MAQRNSEKVNIAMLGDSGTGKTSLALKYMKKTVEANITSTIDLMETEKWFDGRLINVRIWDTAGQERFRSITRSYYRVAEGVLLVYDCTQLFTVTHLQSWLDDIEQFAKPDVVVMLVCNKTDLLERDSVVYTRAKLQGEQFANDHGILFKQTSAKDHKATEAVFDALIREVLKKKAPENQIVALPGCSPADEFDSIFDDVTYRRPAAAADGNALYRPNIKIEHHHHHYYASDSKCKC